ncbi:MAG: VCBS repeat-containing protein [Deltaproteobacteria bacterium]|nr:VCBS repeat-containing protein [Deltaproteobacteria bacterium]
MSFQLTAALIVGLLFVCSPAVASNVAQSQSAYTSSTAGVVTGGGTIKVDKMISDIKSSTTTEITLEWDPSPQNEITGYLLFYGNASGKYLSPVDVGLATSYSLPALSEKKTWYFAVKAYDAQGNQSDYSNEVVKEQIALNKTDSTKSAAMSFTHDPLIINQAFGENYNPDEEPVSGGGTYHDSGISGRIVAGTGSWPSNGGWVKTLTDDYFHDHWSRIGWDHYNENRGESRVARGDIDGDGKDEIIIGMGPVADDITAPAGHFEVLDDNHQHLFWGQVNWEPYNEGNGETWPACGDIDGDGKDEILIGLGKGGMGIIEVFTVKNNQLQHLSWIASTWDEYNSALGEVRPASGDLDGDGRDDIIIGLGAVADNPEIPGGTYEVLSGTGEHMAWGEVNWSDYNQLNGESRPVIGDMNGDGTNEIVIGLGAGSNGALEVQSYNGGNITNQAWLEVPWWQEYNQISGETRPAVGNLDNDKSDELVVALGRGGGGWIHLFDDANSGYNHYISLQLWPAEYNLGNGASWVTIQEGAGN